ncbi:hypothetical protein ACIHFD_07645 [Nonomuraea sp. NPDC051941]|uniref:hypothetical protein n=1 Tax=Nonomuraea sp. NPDC051941 TaxID=3364373 RepID=UPI0037CA4A0E
MLPEITPSSFAGLTQHITDAARRHQLSVTVATSNGDVEVEREHVAELARRRVSGVILLSVEPFQDSSWAAAVGVPVLVLGRPFTVVEGAAPAFHLAGHGRRRITRVSGCAAILLHPAARARGHARAR